MQKMRKPMKTDKMVSEIRIRNRRGMAVIEIEGVIGVPEDMQFESPGDRVATYDRFRNALRRISDIRTDEVVVNIRSTGGDVNDALLIYEALTALEARVTTRCYGYVASAATIIAQAASPGCREVSANSLYLIHCSRSSAEGNSQTLDRTRELLEATDERIAAIYASRSGRPAEEYFELMNENGGEGRWLSPEEVIGYGLADRIVASGPINGHAGTLSLIGVAELPPLPDPVSDTSPKGIVQSRLRTVIDDVSRLLKSIRTRMETLNDRPFFSESDGGGIPESEIHPANEGKPDSKRIDAPGGKGNTIDPASGPVDLQVRSEEDVMRSKSLDIAAMREAQKQACRTRTVPVEDPSAVGDIYRTANQEAYENDLMALKR